MPITKHEEKMVDLQHQLRENQHDVEEFLSDMQNWETRMRKKDTNLKMEGPVIEAQLPPVRNTLDQKKLRKKKKRTTERVQNKPKRISSYDYLSWDTFDVNKAIEEVDRQKDSSSEYETDEEWDTERKKHLAEEEKEKGNAYFRGGEYDQAIEHYSRGLQLDPTNHLLPANRAMALIKQKKFAAAEVDATTAISLDPLYVKAYMRRASAMVGLTKFELARADYERILNLEPQNKLAKAELEKTEKELMRSVSRHPEEKLFTQEPGIISPLHKSSECRSMKSLRRIAIEEVGIESQGDDVVTTTFKQSKSLQRITEKDNRMFQKFVSKSDSLAKSVKPKAVEKLGDSESKQRNALSDAEEGHSSSSVSLATDGTFSESSDDMSGKSVPQTSYHFQSDYKVLKHNKEAFFHYFKRIAPSTFPTLFGEMLDSDILVNILAVFKEFYVPAGDSFEEHLVSLTRVKRFEMTALFLSEREKQLVSNLIAHLKQTSSSREEDINNLAKKYRVL
ncbi:RNA polymerase II-associated protein 3-like isoform X1 [Haliotis rufescens]|uniref:RNA polymerase II-associated protein 3-like isoform X1 n=1 Tax=Haliotis rufescens TaxID=6454 RepID=UPI001EAFA5E4|nr:RNA polymerase II-associated protein 3-like isoform X1 [Haliotis rufescens]